MPILSRAMVAGSEREAGQELVLPLLGWGGPQPVLQHLAAPSPSGGTWPLCLRWAVRGSGVHQVFWLPAAGCRRGRRWGAWHPVLPQTRMLRLPPAYGVRNVLTPFHLPRHLNDSCLHHAAPPPAQLKAPVPTPAPAAEAPRRPNEEMGRLGHMPCPSGGTAAVQPRGACLLPRTQLEGMVS